MKTGNRTQTPRSFAPYTEAKFGPSEKGGGGWGRLQSIEMKFFTRTAGYTLFDYKRYEEILEELKVVPAEEKLR